MGTFVCPVPEGFNGTAADAVRLLAEGILAKQSSRGVVDHEIPSEIMDPEKGYATFDEAFNGNIRLYQHLTRATGYPFPFPVLFCQMAGIDGKGEISLGFNAPPRFAVEKVEGGEG